MSKGTYRCLSGHTGRFIEWLQWVIAGYRVVTVGYSRLQLVTD